MDKLQTHWENDHKDLEFSNELDEGNCDICNKMFATQGSLDRHKLSIHLKDFNICSKIVKSRICKEVLEGIWKRSKHMRQVHKKGEILKWKCLFCNSEFELYDDFKEHIETHKDVFICIICGDHFPDSSARTFHIKIKHSREKLKKIYTCDICGHMKSEKEHLKLHMIKHTLDKNLYMCELCGKSYYLMTVRNFELKFSITL